MSGLSSQLAPLARRSRATVWIAKHYYTTPRAKTPFPRFDNTKRWLTIAIGTLLNETLWEDVEMKNDTRAIGATIEKLRRGQRLTRRQLAGIVGSKKYRIRSLEDGLCNPNLKELRRIAIALKARLTVTLVPDRKES